MLLGEFEHTIDDKSRLTLPARFRQAFAEGVVVTTAGSLGGWVRPGGPFRAAPLPGPIEDAYGCGDCFAAGLTFALAEGRAMEEALALAARCGAAVLTGRGAYAGQLTAAAV